MHEALVGGRDPTFGIGNQEITSLSIRSYGAGCNRVKHIRYLEPHRRSWMCQTDIPV